jgi:hypothetical protein
VQLLRVLKHLSGQSDDTLKEGEKSLTAKFWSSVSFNNNKARNAVAPIVLSFIFKTEGMVTLQLIQVIIVRYPIETRIRN